MKLDDIKNWNETECSVCAAKPGTPSLCQSCLENRDKIWKLKAFAEKLSENLERQKTMVAELGADLHDMKVRERALQDTLVHFSRVNEGRKS